MTDDAKLAEAARMLRAWQGSPDWMMAPEELDALNALCEAHEPVEWPPIEYGPLEAEDDEHSDSGPGFYTDSGVIIGPRCCDDLMDMLVRHSLEPLDVEILTAWFAERRVLSPRTAAKGAVAYLLRRKLLKRGLYAPCYYLRVGHRRD